MSSRNTRLTTTQGAAPSADRKKPTTRVTSPISPKSNKPAPLPKELANVAKFIADQKASGLKMKTGILAGKRVNLFKGSKAVDALLSSNYVAKAKGPKIATEEEATTVLSQLISHQAMLRVKHPEGAPSKKHVTIHNQQIAGPDFEYVFLYEGSKTMVILGSIGLVLGVLAFVMFPLWPPIMRTGMSYVTMGLFGFMGFLAVLGVVRLILFGITAVVLKPGIWLFPRLWDDIGFFESFVPLWAWHVSETEAKKIKKEERRAKKERKEAKRLAKKNKKESSKASLSDSKKSDKSSDSFEAVDGPGKNSDSSSSED